jgi:orotate phosphoribosyltransferase
MTTTTVRTRGRGASLPALVSDDLKARFIRLLSESSALLTGDFELKSGQRSPYFIDFGAVADGRHLEQMGSYYAEAIDEAIGVDAFDVVFGPAYKAIPIATATAIALARDLAASKRYAFNRKVAKTYGEGRHILGSEITPDDRVLIVDDVFTDGGAKVETVELLRQHGDPTVVGVLVGVDRSEGEAMERFREQTGGLPVHSICTIAEVHAALGGAAAATP